MIVCKEGSSTSREKILTARFRSLPYAALSLVGMTRRLEKSVRLLTRLSVWFLLALARAGFNQKRERNPMLPRSLVMDKGWSYSPSVSRPYWKLKLRYTAYPHAGCCLSNVYGLMFIEKEVHWVGWEPDFRVTYFCTRYYSEVHYWS
jgi:hypothetical protein